MNYLTQSEVDFLKTSLNQTLRGLEEARKDAKYVAKRLKELGLDPDLANQYKELRAINKYRAKFAEIQRKLKRGLVTEGRQDSKVVTHNYTIASLDDDIDLRGIMARNMRGDW